MADVFSAKKRSAIMSRVRSRGNKATELAMISFLRQHRISGWRRGANVFGHPDFVFTAERTAVFVDGCFWHGCPKHKSQPASNGTFWQAKLARNKARDRLVARVLREHGWHVVRVWQHELSSRNSSRLRYRLQRHLQRR